RRATLRLRDRSGRRSQGMFGDQVLCDNPTRDQVFVNDAIKHRRVAGAVPSALRVDDRHGAALADPQAVGLGPEDAALLGEPERLQSRLQMVPGLEPASLLATLRRRLVAAEKDVAFRDGDT